MMDMADAYTQWFWDIAALYPPEIWTMRSDVLRDVMVTYGDTTVEDV